MFDLNNKQILFVDDDKNILSGIKRQFHREYEIHTALGGEAAIELIKEQQPFAVIVTDLRMDGMDGLCFMKEAQKITPDSIFIMLTGFADTDVAVKAVNEEKIFRFLTKPCPPEVLKEAISGALEQYNKIMSMCSFTYVTHIEDGQMVLTERSEGCMAVTGYSAQDFIKDSYLWLYMILPEYRNWVQKQIESLIQGDEVGPMEYKIKTKNGKIRWIRNTIIPQKKSNDEIFQLDGLIEDITERRQFEEALQQSECRYQKMVANIPGLVYQFVLKTDGSMRFIFLSESTLEMFGLNPEEIIDDYSILLDKFKPEDRSEIFHSMAESAEKLTPWEWWASGTFNGQDRLFQSIARPERLDNGDTLWDGMMTDMTEFRMIEEKVRQIARFPSENPNPVLRVSGEGKIIFANKASDPLLKLWAKKVNDMLPEHLLEITQNIKSSGKYETVEVQCKDRIYSIVFASIIEIDYVNLYARDITDVKKAQLELIKANEILREHDRLKSEFVSTVSHELRTPLCIFKNIVSNAMAGVMGKVSKKLYESLKMADTSIDRLSRIVSDFLDISKIESGAMKLTREKISVQAIINEVTNSLVSLADAKGIDLIKTQPDEDIQVEVDKDRIVQVLTNLIGNAIKFIPVSSTIEVELTDNGDEAQVAVCDNGPGLNKEEMEKIFDRFVQIHQISGAGEHGTGLGLTIAKELVEMHGGKIWLESAPGKGCSFYFTLPKAKILEENPESEPIVTVSH